MAGQENIGKALGLGMVVIIAVAMVIYVAAAAEGGAMAAVADGRGLAERSPGRRPAPARRRRRLAASGAGWSWSSPASTSCIPLYAALRFAGIGAFGSVVGQAGLHRALALSVRLAVITTVLTIVLMLPTAVYVHLRLPSCGGCWRGSRSCRS